MNLDDFAASFSEEPGYLNFASVGPIGRTVEEELHAQTRLLATARFGTLDSLNDEDSRVRDAVSHVTGYRPDQVVFQPNATQGMMHAMFGITGGVAMSGAEYPSIPFAAARAAQASTYSSNHSRQRLSPVNR